VRLETPESGDDRFNLVMAPVEWTEIHELAKFARAGIAHDAEAPYVAQVFVYIFLQPRDLIKDTDTQAALAAIDCLATGAHPDADGGDVVLRLPKAQMRQILMMLGMAAESEDQAEIVHDGRPEEFPYRFPDMQFPGDYYAKLLDDLLAALYRDSALTLNRLSSQ
jgi:hypothetical protein